MNLIRFVLATLPLWAPAPVFAQAPEPTLPSLDPALDIEQYVHHVWSIEDGLPHNAIRSIIQTRDGYLWLGTQGGITRFDGIRFTSFSTANTPEFSNNFVDPLIETRDGSLWIGFRRGGLVRLNGDVVTTFTAADGLPHQTIYDLLEDRDGRIWIASEGGLAHFENDRFTTYTPADGIPRAAIETIEQAPDGSLWLGARSAGLIHLDGGRFTVYPNDDRFRGNVQVLHATPDSALWVGTDAGHLYRFQAGAFAEYGLPQWRGTNMITALWEDRVGTLWVGVNNFGLARIVDGKISTFTPADGFSDNRVLSIFEDREGNLWIGTYGGGLNRLKNGRIVPFTTAEGLTDNDIRSVHEDDVGNLWVAGAGGVSRLENNRFVPFAVTGDLVSGLVSAVFGDGRGGLWVGTRNNGLYHIERGRSTRYSVTDGLNHLEVNALLKDQAGDLWIGTRRGLNRLRDGAFESYTVAQGLPTSRVIALYEDFAGAVWVGTEGGIARWIGDGFEPVPGPTSGRAFHQDASGAMWVGTIGDGLYRLDDDGFTVFKAADGLYDDYVWMILEDDFGTLWMCSDRGIFTAERKELEDFASGEVSSLHSTWYGTADGMKTPECNGGSYPSAWKSRDGNLWFATVGGVVRVDPSPQPNPLPPPVYIDGVFHKGEQLIVSDEIRLPAGNRNLEFHFTGLSLLDSEKLRFRYRLEGHDDSWVESGNRRWVAYSNLPPGKYRFHVTASHIDGEWTEAGASLAFEFRPFFHETVWFYAMTALLLGVLAYIGHTWSVRRLAAQRSLLEHKVAERTADLDAARKVLEQRVEERTASLRETEERYRGLFESANDGILVIKDGKVIDCNERAIDIIGRSREEIISTYSPGVWAPATQPDGANSRERAGELVKAATEEGPLTFEWTVLRGDSTTVDIEANLTNVQIGDESVLLAVLRDITERKSLESQLRQSQKMDAIGQLAGGIAHDFNNLLTAIFGHVELAQLTLKTPLPDTQALSLHIGEVEKAGHRAAALTRQLLTFSRRQVVSPEVVNMNGVLADLDPMLRRLIREDINLRIVCGADIQSVRADPSQLQQVVVNLVVNAVDAMPDGGSLTIETTEIDVDEEFAAQHQDATSGRKVLLTVSDNGRGMPRETQLRAFEPFFTTKPVGEGTGLGLATVHGIVKGAGGHVQIYSELGLGTTFKVFLPVAGVTEPVESVKEREHVDGGHETVLVCEDESAVRDLVCRILRAKGYQVLSADRPSRAIEMARSHQGSIDLLLTDVIMPEMKGPELAEALRNVTPVRHILYVSGYTENILDQHGINTEGVAFLHKPFSSRELLRRVRTLLDERGRGGYTTRPERARAKSKR